MCTATWVRREGGYELFFNRDERLSRGPELPPRVEERSGVRRVFPIDSDAGGTWIAANEHGLTVFLMNGRADPVPPEGKRRSRGALVADLSDLADPGELHGRIDALDLARFAPFALGVLAPGTPLRLAEWDGAELALSADAEERLPLASSSALPDAAAATRRAQLELFARGRALDAALLERFHGSHPDGPGPLSPCMHREDAQTRSLTRVSVTPERVLLRHAAGPPCRGGAASEVGLRRVGARP